MVQEVMKKQEQATWLADSILETNRTAPAADYKQARGLIDQHLTALDLMESDAARLLATYGVHLPRPAPMPKLKMPPRLRRRRRRPGLRGKPSQRRRLAH